MFGVRLSKTDKQILVVSTKTHTDTINTQKVDRKYFSVQVPGDWKDASVSPVPDSHASFQSPDGAFISIDVFEAHLDPKDALADAVRNEEETGIKGIKTNFDRWGRYKGVGADLKGCLDSLNCGGVRIFFHNTQRNKMFEIREQHWDRDMAKTAEGFKLIEKSFKFKS